MAVAGLAVLCVLAAGCGGGGGSSGAGVARIGSSSTTTATSTTPAGSTSTRAQEQGLLDFSRCMRTHGVADFPDPKLNANGTFGFSDLTALRKLVRGDQQAFTTCEPVLARTGILSAGNIAQFEQQLLGFSKCMRSHGETQFPDPGAAGGFGGQLKNLDRNSPTFQAALTACRPELAAAFGAFSVGAATTTAGG
jgi:hypothetical protein